MTYFKGAVSTTTHTHTNLYVSVDKVLGASAVDPLAPGDLLLFGHPPGRLVSITVEPHQDLTIYLTAGPAAHLSKLGH